MLGVYDLESSGATIRTINDAEFRDFYYSRYGAQRWEEKYERNATVIITRQRDILNR